MESSLYKSKPLWLIPLCFGLIVAASGWWANREVGQAIKGKLKEELQTALHANVTALEIWMQNQERLASAVAGDPHILETGMRLLESLSETAPTHERLVELSEEKEFGRYLDQRIRQLNYLVGFLINTNGVIVGDSGRGKFLLGSSIREEHQVKYSQLFESGEPVIITPFKRSGGRQLEYLRNDPRFKRWMERFRSRRDASTEDRPPRPPNRNRNNTMMQVAAPIKNAGGEVIGALALVINPESEFSRILTVASPGETGETYAFDSEGMMISKSRFEDQLRQIGLIDAEPDSSAALNLALRDPGGNLTEKFKLAKDRSDWPLTRIVNDAVRGVDGVDVESFRDYRGVPVVGAWKWLPEYQFGVATKINAAEAYRPLYVLKWIFVVLFLLLLLASLGMLVFSYSNVILRRRFNEAALQARQLGQYNLEKKIGEGGMGVVYKARHALLRRETAVKLLLPEKADPSAVRRFEREVQSTCNLTHPNTIQVFDYGRTPEGIFYYAMEFLNGFNLLELVRRYGPQSEARVIHILIQICDSLQEAHSVGLVHRDIKPANVFLCVRGGIPDTVKVLDFGLVSTLADRSGDDPSKTSSHAIAGTPHFMAPEAFKHPEQADHRSDLYAVGAVGYFLLTGAYTYSGKTIFEVYDQQTSTRLQPPVERLEKPLCPHVNTVIMQCLEKDPDDRPQSAEALKTALRKSVYATSWTMEDRVEWWRNYSQAAENEAALEHTTSLRPEEPTMRIDLDRRSVGSKVNC